MRENYFSEERLGIFRKVLTENNIPIEEDRIDYGGFWEGPTTAVMDKFLSSGKPIDCIISANDLMAMVQKTFRSRIESSGGCSGLGL